MSYICSKAGNASPSRQSGSFRGSVGDEISGCPTVVTYPCTVRRDLGGVVVVRRRRRRGCGGGVSSAGAIVTCLGRGSVGDEISGCPTVVTYPCTVSSWPYCIYSSLLDTHSRERIRIGDSERRSRSQDRRDLGGVVVVRRRRRRGRDQRLPHRCHIPLHGFILALLHI
jgi:hypothetical protein